MRIKTLLVCLTLPYLVSCGQIFNSSTAVFLPTENDVELVAKLQNAVEERATESDSNCKNTENRGATFLSCLTPGKLSVYAGTDENGHVFFDLNSGRVVLWATQKQLDNVSLLTGEHRDWEDWFNAEFSEYEFVKKEHYTTGGSPQNF